MKRKVKIRQAILIVLIASFILTMFAAAYIPANAASRYDKNKKGVLLESTIAGNTDILHELGVTQITYNLPLSLLTEGGGYPYTYKGVTYNFNRGTIGGYDSLVKKMNNAGISVTLIILNDWHGGMAETRRLFIHSPAILLAQIIMLSIRQSKLVWTSSKLSPSSLRNAIPDRWEWLTIGSSATR